MVHYTALLTALPLLASSAFAATSNYGVVDMPAARFERRIAAANSTTGTSLVQRSTIEKRAYSGRATWYQAGLGACGGVNSGSDKIVALGQVIWDTRPAPNGNPNLSPWCGEKVCISYGGQSHEATIVDLCPYSGGCSPSDGAALDMSESLFSQFGGLGLGVFQMTWTLGGCGGGAPAAIELPAPAQQKDDDNDWQKQEDAKNAKEAADKAAADQAAQAQAAADEAGRQAEREAKAAAKKAADDAAWAAQQSQSAADHERYLASISSQNEQAYLASISSESVAQAAASREAAEASRSAEEARASEASIASAQGARLARIASQSEASVESVASVRSERAESRSIVSAASVRSERIESMSAASASVAPVVEAMADVNEQLAALFVPKATPAPKSSKSDR